MITNEQSEKCKKVHHLTLPHQFNGHHHNEFLHTMTKVFRWSRLIGIVGLEKLAWKLWGLLVLALFLIIEGQAIWKVIKALAGWASDVAAHRSVTSRISGGMFYTAALLGLLQCWRLSSSWKDIAQYWASVEWVMPDKYIPADKTLKRRMCGAITFVAFSTIFEHILCILSFVDFHCEPSSCFRKYILLSHGFLLLEDEYSDWLALPLFLMSIIATILWNLQDLIITLTSMGLTSRYRRLNEGVAAVIRNYQVDEYYTDTEFLDVSMWRKIREAYVKQSMLVRRVDKSLGGLILVSTFFNFYFICLQLFLGITQDTANTPLQDTYLTISMVWLSTRTILTVVTAADVCKHSTLALPSLYECRGQYYNVEIERLQKQLTKDYVALSGMGFFYLNRNVVLQMAAAVVTYVLVLIQYDDSDDSSITTPGI